MGLFDKLASKLVPELGDIETSMAKDPKAPAEMLRKMAKQEPKLWDAILENPSCPEDVRQYITNARNAR